MTSLKKFIDKYVSVVLKVVQKRGDLGLKEFYDYHVFKEVSKRTGFSEEQVRYMHYAFHWNLFSRKDSPLELIPFEESEENYKVEAKDGPPKKSKLIRQILKKDRKWLEARFKSL